MNSFIFIFFQFFLLTSSFNHVNSEFKVVNFKLNSCELTQLGKIDLDTMGNTINSFEFLQNRNVYFKVRPVHSYSEYSRDSLLAYKRFLTLINYLEVNYQVSKNRFLFCYVKYSYTDDDPNYTGLAVSAAEY